MENSPEILRQESVCCDDWKEGGIRYTSGGCREIRMQPWVVEVLFGTLVATRVHETENMNQNVV